MKISDRVRPLNIRQRLRFIRAVSNGSFLAFLISYVITPTASGILLFRLKSRKLQSTLLLLLTPALALSALREIKRKADSRPVKRRESVPRPGTAAMLNFQFRNPRWAVEHDDAARPSQGFDPAICVDGTAEALQLAPELFTDAQRERSHHCRLRRLTVQLDVWLVPFAAYHLDELGPLIGELEKHGLRAGIVFASEPSEGLLSAAGAHTTEAYLFPHLQASPPLTVFSMIDWGAAEEVVTWSKSFNIPVVSKVEGTQDFENRETPHSRLPYARADVVLAQGPYDAAAVSNGTVEIVGSSRLERLRRLESAGLIERPQRAALINLNFSYGVMTVWERPWYALAQRGCERASLPSHTSVHPAVDPARARNASNWPLALDIETHSHLITRRSAILLDALTIGRPVVIFNPHHEPVWRAIDWHSCVPVAHTARGLARHLEGLDPDDASQVRARQQFVADRFVSFDARQSCAARSASVIASVCGRRQASQTPHLKTR